jgi:hypothetical protein
MIAPCADQLAPKALTPSIWAAKSARCASSRRLFLCHSAALLVQPAIAPICSSVNCWRDPWRFWLVLAPAHLEDADLVVLAVRQTVATTVAPDTGECRLQIAAVADRQNLSITISWAYSPQHLFYFDFFRRKQRDTACRGFYDRVHEDLLD